MNILVTGGAGYVGSLLVPKLLDLGHSVTVLDLYLFGDDVLSKHNRLLEIKGDLRDKAVVKKSLKNIDTVIHLACISNDPSFELDPKLGKSINYDATKQLIDLSRLENVKRFIYASSSSVYGVKAEAEVTEDLSLEPLTDYSKYKALSETYLLQNSGLMTPVVLRPATVCGWSPRLRLDLTVNILTIHALVNNKILVHGGKQTRPNIHINDMVDCYIHMLSAPERIISHSVYNVGYENYSILDIASMVKKVIGKSTITISITDTNDNRSYRVSSKKIKKELGFEAKRTVEDAIGDLVSAYNSGLIPKPFDNERYYNIQTMKTYRLGAKKS